jgi:hypothetical protein
LAGLPSTGNPDFSDEIGKGNTPRNGAGVDRRLGGQATFGQDLSEQPTEGMTDHGRLSVQPADDRLEMLSHRPDGFAGKHLRMSLRLLNCQVGQILEILLAP